MQLLIVTVDITFEFSSCVWATHTYYKWIYSVTTHGFFVGLNEKRLTSLSLSLSPYLFDPNSLSSPLSPLTARSKLVGFLITVVNIDAGWMRSHAGKFIIVHDCLHWLERYTLWKLGRMELHNCRQRLRMIYCWSFKFEMKSLKRGRPRSEEDSEEIGFGEDFREKLWCLLES